MKALDGKLAPFVVAGLITAIFAVVGITEDGLGFGTLIRLLGIYTFFLTGLTIMMAGLDPETYKFPRRVFALSYIVMVGLILLMGVVLA